MKTLHVKKGDMVVVLTGEDRGKKGKVLRALPREGKIVVEGVNVKKKHRRAMKGGQKGQIIEKSFPVHVSNVRKEESKRRAKKS